MNCVVCLKYAVIPAQKGRLAELDCGPADMAALALALQLCGEGSVTAISMGGHEVEEAYKYLSVYGVERLVLLSDKQMAGSDTYATATVLAAAIKQMGPFDMILCGRRALGGETGQVPGELAAMLSLPCVTNVLSVSQTQDTLLCRRMTEKGVQTVKAPMPSVISCCEYSGALPNPSLKGLRRLSSARVEVLSVAQLGLDATDCGQKGSRTMVRSVAPVHLYRKPKWLQRDDAGRDTILQLLKEKENE